MVSTIRNGMHLVELRDLTGAEYQSFRQLLQDKMFTPVTRAVEYPYTPNDSQVRLWYYAGYFQSHAIPAIELWVTQQKAEKLQEASA